MAESYKDEIITSSFDIKEYVEINNDAAVRTRWISLILVIATVLIGVGFYNSLRSSWARYRYESIYNNEYIQNINLSSENGDYPILDIFFGEKDFKKSAADSEVDKTSEKVEPVKAFACHILKDSSKNPVSEYLFSKFNEKSRTLLKNQCATKNDDPATEDVLKTSLLLDLNMILKDRFFYDEKLFKEIKNDETNKFLQSLKQEGSIFETKPKDLIQLNRLLLEDTYPTYILKSRDIVPVDEEKNANILSPDEKRRLQRQNETIRAYVDNVQWITIPVFGISIDVNDLGTIGGFALFIVVLLLRFSLSREIKNLNISFRESARHDKLCPFYHLLAMRQVLTVPQMRGEIKNKGLAACSKLLCLLPAIILTLGVSYDIYSTYKLLLYEPNTAINTLLFGVFWVVLVSYFSLRCIERKIHIDEIWNDYYLIMNSRKEFKLLTGKSFQDSEDRDLVSVVNHRLHNIPKPNIFWIYKLIAQTPNFFVAFLKNLFKRQRFEVLLPFLLEPELENENNRNESEIFIRLKKWKNRFVMIALSLLTAKIFLAAIMNFSAIITCISKTVSEFLKLFQYNYLIPYFKNFESIIFETFILFLVLSVIFIILVDQKNKLTILNYNEQTGNENKSRENKQAGSINRKDNHKKNRSRK